jgi:hypothetical protein
LSVYTTEVRYICEYEAGLIESTGYNDIDDVIAKSWDKIFKKFPIFDETYRKQLCTKILNHYYTREIGAETASLWKFWLNQKMNEIMPYYNKLYLTEQIKFDPLHEIDFTRTINEKIESGKNGDETTNTTNAKNANESTTNAGHTETTSSNISKTSSELSRQNTDTNSTTSSETTTLDTSGNKQNLHSDTPQGSIKDISTNGYLTDATLTTDTSNSSTESNKSVTENKSSTEKTTGIDENNATTTATGDNNSTTSSTSSDSMNGKTSSLYNETNNESRKYTEQITGKNSSVSYSKMLEEYRTTLLNIDMDIIFELRDLFLNIY